MGEESLFICFSKISQLNPHSKGNAASVSLSKASLSGLWVLVFQRALRWGGRSSGTLLCQSLLDTGYIRMELWRLKLGCSY